MSFKTDSIMSVILLVDSSFVGLAFNNVLCAATTTSDALAELVAIGHSPIPGAVRQRNDVNVSSSELHPTTDVGLANAKTHTLTMDSALLDTRYMLFSVNF